MATLRSISKKALSQVQKTYEPELFLPQFVNNRWRAPKYGLRIQANMRKNCILSGIDPISIGLPPVKESKPVRVKPPKGTKIQRTYVEKQAKIRDNLTKMDEKITNWRQEQRKEKAKTKSVMPF
ncbi:hypothetical protein K493DRAFT_205135 [Basidiobolus meristosporus CBS 931.73]|uniref:Large ribosomal subunit protein mL59 domain-containing protein n=1 Tax=Basidiobolus meristosporus CBS 931.73 TaxID=1314790 RepID=A0A1Y1Z512_9FUNG|nr:hypothetical protein K493DRAFT_205135 [Basidiobolus meristosporus CBS 931.73]|eukprot:ORY04905.1 hypothetical protein K493DRAFT_205135 [Basidiobolus meristosporus CBS 931.73]